MDEKQTDSEEVQPLYVSLIFDESGSMQSCKRVAIEGAIRETFRDLSRRTADFRRHLGH